GLDHEQFNHGAGVDHSSAFVSCKPEPSETSGRRNAPAFGLNLDTAEPRQKKIAEKLHLTGIQRLDRFASALAFFPPVAKAEKSPPTRRQRKNEEAGTGEQEHDPQPKVIEANPVLKLLRHPRRRKQKRTDDQGDDENRLPALCKNPEAGGNEPFGHGKHPELKIACG